jgi:CxxC motif-containing protein (DUF1111 family)
MKDSVSAASALLISVLAWLAESPALGQPQTGGDAIEAYTHLLSPSAPSAEVLVEGQRLFRQAWVMPPARDDAEFVGLGPVYNDISCLGCHVRNGRGNAPAGEGRPLHGALLRLSTGGKTADGGPAPVPAYGDQIGDHANPGVPPEGTVRVTYRSRSAPLGLELREPQISIGNLAFGDLPQGTLMSLRVAQPVFGIGLLQAIPERDIRALANEQAAEKGSVRGHVNEVWDVALGRAALGRFGWKANQPSVAQQVAAAANGDMGLTSPLFPAANCPSAQSACLAAAKGRQPALTDVRLQALVSYLVDLAPPRQRDPERPSVKHGAKIFENIGCAECHRPAWRIAADSAGTHPTDITIHPYTDLLLHDLGPGLADGRPDFLASGSEWRTAPLWGLGLTLTVNPAAGLLHDGRARTIAEAILWHAGEAGDARRGFVELTSADRADLMNFLNSL